MNASYMNNLDLHSVPAVNVFYTVSRKTRKMYSLVRKLRAVDAGARRSRRIARLGGKSGPIWQHCWWRILLSVS